MDHLMAIRNFKDFLLLYNEISETCFQRCASTMNRELSNTEETCVNNCAEKYRNANQRIMGVYVEVQAALVNKRMEEMQKASETAAAAAASETAVAAAASEVAEASTIADARNVPEVASATVASQEQAVAL